MTMTAVRELRTAQTVRVGTTRHYLMCRPTYFAVDYAINPWMQLATPVDVDLAISQWEHLRQTYLDLGHRVSLIEPLPDLPDMVFAANGGLVIGGRALGARFRYAERAAEGPAYLEWFEESGGRAGIRSAYEPAAINEGEGDFLVVGDMILAGTGFRTDLAAHREAAELFGRPVVSLELVDPRYYHLDTALVALDDETIAYHPPAFSPGSRRALERLFPDAIRVTEPDARVLGLNAVSDGYHVVLPAAATGFAAQVRARGFEPVPVDVSELLKAGGSVKCCTLELRGGG
jgi:N-dimethylarginine dimethylaminohydrolase